VNWEQCQVQGTWQRVVVGGGGSQSGITEKNQPGMKSRGHAMDLALTEKREGGGGRSNLC